MKTRNGFEVLDSLASIPVSEWDALAAGNPLLSHAFLHALHETGCAGAEAGWSPCYITLWREGRLAGAMPLYLKSHSYGEYVFDWAWADAYQRHGLRYYPKLLNAVPFTPVTGPRLLAGNDEDRRALAEAALSFARDTGVSSLHCLFPRSEDVGSFEAAGMMLRASVQFHWRNEGFADFEDFLGRMNHDKRKKVRQERRKVHDAGIEFRRLRGDETSESDWRFFVQCYNRTYRAHHSTPYLNLAFFLKVAETMPRNLLLMIGHRAGEPVASAFNIIGDDVLYGRYWGTKEFHSGLHFEACYYQAIEYCIEQGIGHFEGGAQGEHKLARGLLPQRTVSAHWLAHPEFAEAITRFLQKEANGIGHYVDELSEHSPFKQADVSAE
ncbi:MAG TPA: GNAT family N-acetyltransferase [Burkholderiales bacterium]|nr:GNAT family N-acetyltransferase [Burkholderiales bacterium]